MRWLGFAVLFPWLRYRFASRRMTPRFDPKGRVYMLLCDDTYREEFLAQVNAEMEPHEPRTEDDKKEDDMDRQRAYPERRP